MFHTPPESSKILEIYLLIAQYPMLASGIRRRMREELFRRGIITPQRFDAEVKEKAVLSQQREGIRDGLVEESAQQWDLRWSRVRRTLTDFYFAYNLPIEILHHILDELHTPRADGSSISPDQSLPFNPELAPLEMVLRQAEKYEALLEEERAAIDHHLQELRVVLLKSLVSDQLAFIHIARRWFTAADFNMILERRIGTGKIGGKSAGLLLAYKILQGTAAEIFDQIRLPQSYFIGADVFYDFMSGNHLEFLNQKYKTAEQIRDDYPKIQEQYSHGRFPDEIAHQLRDILRLVGSTPLIVRSSSLLEDNFGMSFAGKYLSIFCPNQGTIKENMRDLTRAIRQIYASVFGPDALMYRRHVGLLDYDERMAILLQEVQGERHRQYFFPALAGVAYSYSPIVWNTALKREEGFMRLVMGLGTRAVDRIAGDYPRMVNLSHPQLRPEVMPKAIHYYSQHFVDALDLEQNTLTTVPAESVLGSDYPPLRWLVSVDDGETIHPPLYLMRSIDPAQLVLTFDGLLRRGSFVPLMKTVLTRLAEQYEQPVDIEFAVSVTPGSDQRSSPADQPVLDFHLLQCRPQNQWSAESREVQALPTDLAAQDKILLCTRMVPQGRVSQVEYIIYVDSQAYYQLDTLEQHFEVARYIGRINTALEGQTFILIGPGRWGSSDPMQGVPVTYADIFNARALVEVASNQSGFSSEPSYGTHFFQDLVESQIYPLAVHLAEPGDHLNQEFIRRAENQLPTFFAEQTNASRCIKIIHIPTERPGYQLEIIMDGQSGLGYLTRSKS
ncbi:MAG TPA: PEP/pyruvate-binding domain-containing protein [Anaerolineales bacterium]|nr:PEP/pyruvate-binding domain-containing protein [Anaerolineales bacterium]